ncbi:hypothetical protein Tco_0990236 [Tanacetum coccineum]|uniref:Uncharacterized protein n=1 Tax=Tanacetum coccineum TaxID=301880 RepID=A0ABQ5EXI0_9ASTR
MSADSAVTYTSVHSEARSWSIPSEDPYEEAARQLLEQAPRSLEYVPEDHVPVYIPEPEHPEDLVPAEDDGTYTPITTILLVHDLGRCEIGESLLLLLRRKPVPTIRGPDSENTDEEDDDRLRSWSTGGWIVQLCEERRLRYLRIEERLAYEQMEYGDLVRALAMSEAHCRALRHEFTELETESCIATLWQRSLQFDWLFQAYLCVPGLEAGARVDTLEDTG